MGLETRKGKLYYYHKRREGDHVVSEYVGGDVASIALYRAERERREAERQKVCAIKGNLADIDLHLDVFCSQVDRLLSDSLLAAGYHQHKGQWRKKRNVRTTETR